VFANKNVVFTMTDGEISGNTAVNDVGGGVFVNDNAVFTMEGGEINGNIAKRGGGVFIDNDGIFTMEGGTISGNTATEGGGGGVFVADNVENGNAEFTMEGGTISGNTAYDDGGGVFVDESATFIMEDGEISGNTARDGGGVFVRENGTFTKKGGIIYGDTDSIHTLGSTENTAQNGDGHAVYAGDKKRNVTADQTVDLYAQYNGTTWTYIDPVGGGVGDTTAAWE
jgi:hypothetical protein